MTILSLNVSLKNAPDKDIVFICKQQIKGEAIDYFGVRFGRPPEAPSHSIATELWEGGKIKNSLQDLKFRDLQLYSWKQK